LTAQSLAESRSLAEQALRLDGGSGMGHRMLAVALYHQAYMGFIPWTEQIIDEIYSHAKISIEAEDADEYCHWAMACAHLLRKEHERGIASLRRALEINPNCSLAHGSIGTGLAWAGQSDDAIQSNELAIRINPHDPSIFFRHLGLALAHYLAARYRPAKDHAGAVLEMRPDWWLGLLIYSASLAQLDRRERALKALNELMRVRPGTNARSLDILPFANTSDREHLLDGLRKAGLPD
jgi:tetratricopeptide (TPR) repeat protein